MRRNIMHGVIPFVLLFSLSCNKDYKSSPDASTSKSMASNSASPGGCRMTSYDYYDGIGDFHSIDYYTYKDGLVDNELTGDLRYNMKYDSENKLIGSTVYEGETLVYIINFVYDKKQLVKEIWRDATTNDIYDEVFLTYDKKGNLIRNE
ncbi:MAG TPA: hypothetical protein VLJ41_14265, partial [Segetibacter sp.]|nr:hypothetical protein [Segetibacter sp.]